MELRCYVCGKVKREVARRIADPADHVCNACLDAQPRAVDSERRPRPAPFSVGQGSEDRAAALVVTYAPGSALLGKRFDLSAPGLRVGRAKDTEIVLDEDIVSRLHARLEPTQEGWSILDVSDCGTWVNEKKVDGARSLTHGDRIKIGSTILIYLSGADLEALYHEEIYRLTIIDGLTGAFVERYLAGELESEIARARRSPRVTSLVMVVLDRLDAVNQSVGRLAGDQLLRDVARVLQGHLRLDDVLARCGGARFAILVRSTPLDQARALAEAMRKSVETSRFAFQGERIPMTISSGVVALGDAHATADSLVSAAHERLNEAKRGGGNRVSA